MDRLIYTWIHLHPSSFLQVLILFIFLFFLFVPPFRTTREWGHPTHPHTYSFNNGGECCSACLCMRRVGQRRRDSGAGNARRIEELVSLAFSSSSSPRSRLPSLSYDDGSALEHQQQQQQPATEDLT